MSALDSFFQPLNNTDTLIDIFEHAKTFEERFEDKLKIRKVLNDVDENDNEDDIEKDGVKDLLALIEEAKSKFKEHVEVYNKTVDEAHQIKGLLGSTSGVCTDTAKHLEDVEKYLQDNKYDQSPEGKETMEIAAETSKILDTFCNRITDVLSVRLEEKEKTMRECRKKIKTLSFLYSYSKNNIGGGYPCPICLTSEVTQFCDPCGHTYCNSCLKANHCYICRAWVDKRHRIFFN